MASQDWANIQFDEMTKDEVEDFSSIGRKPLNPNSASGLLRRSLHDCKRGEGRRIGPLTDDQVYTLRTVLSSVVKQMGWRKNVRGRSRVIKAKVEPAPYGKSYVKIIRLK